MSKSTFYNMQSVSSDAVARALSTYANIVESEWNTTHSFPLDTNSTYIVIIMSPYEYMSDIWFVKSRHIGGLSPYWQSIMKGTRNPTYNFYYNNDVLTIQGDSCSVALIKINKTTS